MDMTKQSRKFTNPFSAALNHCIRMSGETNDIVGEAAGYKSKGKAIDQIRNERSEGKYKYQRAIAEHFGYTLDAFVDFGKDLILKQNRPATFNKNNVISIDQEHADVIRMFQDKKTALEINHILVEIEKSDPEALKRAKELLNIAFQLKKDPPKKRSSGNGGA